MIRQIQKTSETTPQKGNRVSQEQTMTDKNSSLWLKELVISVFAATLLKIPGPRHIHSPKHIASFREVALFHFQYIRPLGKAPKY